MTEGSVFVEGIDADVPEEETADTQVNNPDQQEEVSQPEQSQPQPTEQQPQLTDKGTKLDPNPESAVHQLLANEKRARQQAEAILNNPELLKQYMAKQGIEVAPSKEQPKTSMFSPDKIQTVEDMVNALNTLQSVFEERVSGYEKTIRELQTGIKDLSEGRQVEQIAHTIESDISRVRETYPELNPKNPSYDKALEERISSLYQRFDFDEESGMFKGKVSLADIAKDVVDAYRAAKKSGSLETQTIVKDKSQAKVVTSSKAPESQAQPKDPAAAIALKIKNAYQ